MRLILASAAAALLLAAPAAAAAPDHNDRHHGKQANHSQQSNDHTDRRSRSGNKPDTNRTRRSHGVVTTTQSPGAVYNNAVRKNQRDNNRNRNNANRNSRNDRHNNYDRNRNNNYRNHGNRHWDKNYNRRNVYARHHYHYRGARWYWPHGYSYRRWTFGMTLPSIFWGHDYRIDDYSYYGLAYPPPGTVWVRYGADAILIDQYTGEILEVVYGQFY